MLFGTFVRGSLCLALVAAPARAQESHLAAGTGYGVLVFTPRLPPPGARVAVEYRPSTALAGETRVRLRSCFRTALTDTYDFVPAIAVAELVRGPDGQLHGAFRLPPAVVFASFAVETLDGDRIDDNRGALWEMLTRSPSGLPSYEALHQEAQARMLRSWEAAYATARLAARLYPKDLRSEHALLFFEQFVLGEHAKDSLLLVHKARFAKLHRELSRKQHLSDELMCTMFFSAMSFGDSVARDVWKTRLSEETPPGPCAIQNRIHYDISRRAQAQPASALAGYDSLWSDVADVPGALAHQGKVLPQSAFELAASAGDSSSLLRWADRLLRGTPDDSFYVAVTLARNPKLREAGLARMRDLVLAAEQSNDRLRPLGSTRQEDLMETRLRFGKRLAEYGRALLDAGNRVGAADTLELAASIGWSPALFRDAADAWLALGDTLRAVRLLALVSIDPSTEDSVQRRIQELASRGTTAAQWRVYRDSAALEMRQRLTAEGTDRALASDVQLRDTTGISVTLRELLGGRPGVVVFWSAECGAALETTPRIQRLAVSLEASRVPVIVISEDPMTPARLEVLRERGGRFLVYYDAEREAQNGFENLGTPAFYVLDASGHIRFADGPELGGIVRQLAVLDPSLSLARPGGQ